MQRIGRQSFACLRKYAPRARHITSAVRWLLKEGDSFSAGQAICEVETDKATVTYEATDEGYIAKILVGIGELQVGQPMMVTVDDAADIAAFANFSLADAGGTAPVASSSPEPTQPAATLPPSPTSATPSPPPTTSSNQTAAPSGRVVASPFARKLAREAGLDLAALPAHGLASGPNGRILASDVTTAISKGITSSSPASSGQTSPSTGTAAAETSTMGQSASAFTTANNTGSPSEALTSLFTHSKKVVPHYFLSVELNLSKLMTLRKELGEDKVSVQDFLIKAAAKAMSKVPDVNAAWMDSFVRKYDQVDVNLIVGNGEDLRAPVLQNVSSMGLGAINSTIAEVTSEDSPSKTSPLTTGTFAIHNLGLFGVKSAAPIVLPPQACALALGAVVDTVVPNPLRGQEGQEQFTVAPMMTTTLSCDHRTVDGAVGAGWLAAFKEYVENPITLLL